MSHELGTARARDDAPRAPPRADRAARARDSFAGVGQASLAC